MALVKYLCFTFTVWNSSFQSDDCRRDLVCADRIRNRSGSIAFASPCISPRHSAIFHAISQHPKINGYISMKRSWQNFRQNKDNIFFTCLTEIKLVMRLITFGLARKSFKPLYRITGTVTFSTGYSGGTNRL